MNAHEIKAAETLRAYEDQRAKRWQGKLADTRDFLKERLYAGETVKRLTLADLIDADLSGQRADIATQEITTLVLAASGERAALADAYVDGVIERFLETNEELVSEWAEELASEAPDV